MEEVDKIILHSLNQIGCKLETDDEDDTFALQHFTSDLLVKAVSCCLNEIKPDAKLPKMLPENMAQRFTVATQLAAAVADCGYRADIGYQTFLYPNVVDIRRLFMFLIEQLPKDQLKGEQVDGRPLDEKDNYLQLMREVKQKMKMQLKSPWIPQYCKAIQNTKSITMCNNSLNMAFHPKLNLNIPNDCNALKSSEEANEVPNIFEQTIYENFDLISSVLHKNACDKYYTEKSWEQLRLVRLKSPIKKVAIISKPSLQTEEAEEQQQQHHNNEDFAAESSAEHSTATPLQKLTNEVNNLTIENDRLITQRITANSKLSNIAELKSMTKAEMEELKQSSKLHERTCVILENPMENIEKLEELIDKARERKQQIETQWNLHRDPALKKITELQKQRQAKNYQNIQELRSTINQLELALREKVNLHAKLASELKDATDGIAPRKEYTRRIYEFIGNIRKQRNDIYKILDDTRDLQKQLNSVSAQLQRQFNYTDDLLFQTAKHDMHAKQAYKLLASLHASSNEISELVSSTGNLTKELRDIEEQIDRERMQNVASSLQKITMDIQKFETIINTIQKDAVMVMTDGGDSEQ